MSTTTISFSTVQRYGALSADFYVHMNKYFNNTSSIESIIDKVKDIGEQNYVNFCTTLKNNTALSIPVFNDVISGKYRCNKHVLKVLLLYMLDVGTTALHALLELELKAIEKRMQQLQIVKSHNVN